MISEDAYVDFKGKSEDRLSFKEYIQVKVFETVEKYQRELEKSRMDLSSLTDEAIKFQSALERSQREAEALKKLSKEKDADH